MVGISIFIIIITSSNNFIFTIVWKKSTEKNILIIWNINITEYQEMIK